MKITYDNKIDALYLSLKKGKVIKTAKLSDTILADLNKSGDVLGIEILDASKYSSDDHSSNSISFGGKSFELPSLSK